MIVSKPLSYRVALWVRSRVRTMALLALAIAVVVAAVLSAAAGARRTQTAPDRYQSAFGGEHDLLVTQETGVPATDRVASLPAVADAQAITFLFFGGVVADTGVEIDALPFAGSVDGFPARVIEGREPDPGSVEEFVVTRSVVEQTGMSIGDTAHFVSITPADGDAFGFDARYLNGPQWDAELVGVVKSAAELEDASAIVMFSAARLDGSIHNESTLMRVDLADGATETELRRQLDAALPGESFRIEPSTMVSDDIRTAVRGQSLGLWLLAALGAVAAVAALGHVLTRSVRLTSEEQRSLAALGWTPAEITGESAARAAVVVIAGSIAAVAIAIAASGLFPFGFANDVEPAPGVRVEALVLAGTAAVLAVLLVTWVAVAAAFGSRQRGTTRPSGIASLAARTPWATTATGLRFAFARPSSGTVSLVASVAGTVLSVAALVGTLTFGLSLDRLVDEPARYGVNFDVAMDNGADEVQPEFLQIAVDEPDVSDIELFRGDLARVGDATMPILTSEPVRGAITPVLLSGRLPAGDEEIAIGGVAARKLDVGIGDTITVSTNAASAALEVVGLVVVPGLRGFDVLGENSYVDVDAYEVLFPGSKPQVAAMRIAPGGNVEASREHIAGLIGVTTQDTQLSPPSSIINLRRVTFVPFALSALLLALGSIALVGALWSSVRRREQQIAVLRALGADRAWLRLAAVWHAIAFTVVPALIGAAIGLIAGRLVFRSFADGRGVVDEVATPWTLGVGSIALLVLLAVVATTAAGRRARNAEPALLLRAG